MADLPMYHEYRVHQLVQETIDIVMDATSSIDSEDGTSIKEDLRSDMSEKGDSDLEADETHLARAHWILLHKVNKQGTVIQSTFEHLMTEYKHTRPIWQFGRNIDEHVVTWSKELHEDFYFRHHCASVQAAITMIMENKDDSLALSRVLNEVGAHHFFYDAFEPHLQLFEDAMITAMKKVLTGIDKLDDETEKSWRILLQLTRTHLVEGISIQRTSYLKQAITPQEHTEITEIWARVEEYGLEEAGIRLCKTAFETYKALLAQYDLSLPIPQVPGANDDVFKQFSHMTMTV
ncbi:hypothetical protein PFISCL1PPCAC_2340, partial [Pristionchus fissidentatus]